MHVIKICFNFLCVFIFKFGGGRQEIFIVFLSGFSITNWLAEHTFTSLSTLPVYGQLELQEDLGLAQYLKNKQCTETDDRYIGQTNGWRKGWYNYIYARNIRLKNLWKSGVFQPCMNALFCNITDCPLPVVTSSLPTGALCQIPSTCTSVQCCITTHSPLERSFSVFLDLDPCNHRISLGIENFVHEISLYDFTYGK